MSAQRAKSTVEASHRSIHPNIAGVPWWAALLIATTATAIGYAIDVGSGHKELSHLFAGCYIAGCVAAVLAVRQDGVFTGVVQPPLILFCAVPEAYWLFHGGKIGHLKDLLINCGYPLIERFPLMLGTAAGVLLIGLLRWYFGMSYRPAAAATGSADQSTATASFVAAVVAKLQSLLRPGSGREDAEWAASAVGRRTRASRSTQRPGRTTRSGRSATRTGRAAPRHARQRLDEAPEPTDRPRRPRRDYDTAEPPRRTRRRPRPDT
ncbi:MAG: hypothetical protein PHQ28_08525, partial [Mycobacterium sp.]|nr:hypothetical protein [Mycobacterium sp.]